MIPLSIINLFLLIYLFLFYSSAGYILIYSNEDIRESMQKGAALAVPSIFQPDSFHLAYQHGFVGLIFVVFFFILPVCFALSNMFIDNKRLANFISYVIGLFAVDFFVAIFISKSIQEAKLITNSTNVHWTFLQSFTDINFYLVFVLGAMGLLIFKFTFGKFMLCFAERNPTLQAQKTALDIEQEELAIQNYEQEIIVFEKEIEKIQFSIIDNKKTKEDNQYKLDNLPINESRELTKLKNETNTLQQHYEHITGMYVNKVENNSPRISIDALRDRISIFLEGWNDFLHSHFSYGIATEKSSKATEVVIIWLNDKLNNNQIDSRVNY